MRNDRLGSPRLVLVLRGLPCSYGRCRFCPFALEQGGLRAVLETNEALLREARAVAEEVDPERVSVFNGGSFYELPLAVVQKLAPITRGRVVDVESIPGFVTEESVEATYELLKPRSLVIRVGFEVYDEGLRRKLGKDFPNSEVRRLSELARELRSRGLDVRVLSYVLFGIEGVPEEKVVESVEELGRLLDGVIAVRYRRYLPHHPREVEVSPRLAKYLEERALYVDWGEGEEWEISGTGPRGGG